MNPNISLLLPSLPVGGARGRCFARTGFLPSGVLRHNVHFVKEPLTQLRVERGTREQNVHLERRGEWGDRLFREELRLGGRVHWLLCKCLKQKQDPRREMRDAQGQPSFPANGRAA